jgi:putative endonuclease
MTHTTKILGFAGEAHVAQHLVKQGFSIIAHNYTKPYGEIDLIVKRNGLLAFVEVKTRLDQSLDTTEIITAKKQRSIARVAQQFLSSYTESYTECRFDVAIVHEKQGGYTIMYLENAFMYEED